MRGAAWHADQVSMCAWPIVEFFSTSFFVVAEFTRVCFARGNALCDPDRFSLDAVGVRWCRSLSCVAYCRVFLNNLHRSSAMLTSMILRFRRFVLEREVSMQAVNMSQQCTDVCVVCVQFLGFDTSAIERNSRKAPFRGTDCENAHF